MDNVNRGQRGVKSDETLFRIVEEIHASEGAGVTELATELDMAKSAVHKHLKSLEEHEYVVQRDGGYYLSFKFLSLGGDTRFNDSFYRVARPKIERIADEFGVVVMTSVKEYDRGICLGVSNGLDVDIRLHAGSRFHLHQNAAGKAMLARLSDGTIRSIADRTGLPKVTDRTIDSLDELLGEIEEIRDSGFATNLEESSNGVAGIGVAFDHLPSDSLYSISIACPVSNITRDEVKDQYVEQLFQTRDEIGYQLDSVSPSP